MAFSKRYEYRLLDSHLAGNTMISMLGIDYCASARKFLSTTSRKRPLKSSTIGFTMMINIDSAIRRSSSGPGRWRFWSKCDWMFVRNILSSFSRWCDDSFIVTDTIDCVNPCWVSSDTHEATWLEGKRLIAALSLPLPHLILSTKQKGRSTP